MTTGSGWIKTYSKVGIRPKLPYLVGLDAEVLLVVLVGEEVEAEGDEPGAGRLQLALLRHNHRLQQVRQQHPVNPAGKAQNMGLSRIFS
jgi:hypothetical protein